MTGFRYVFLSFVLALLAESGPLVAQGAQNVELVRARAAMASDSSVRIELDFNGQAPDARLYRSNDKLLHIVFVGARFQKRPELADIRLGEVSRGRFAMFAGVGMRLDLAVHDEVNVRTEAVGNSVFIHIPAKYSDRETAFMPATPAHVAVAPAPIAAPANGIVTAVVPLSYADVSEVAGALVKGAVVPSNDVFTATSPFASLTTPAASADQTRPPAYVSIPAATLLPKDTPQGVRFDEHVAVDRRLNAIILTGTQDQIDTSKAVISALDVPTRSVLLETQIVELTTTAAHDIGVDFAAGGTAFATATFGSNNAGKPTAGFNAAATLSALEQSGQAKILARPRIIAVNNRPAAILSGEAVPIFNSVIIPGGSGTVVNNQVQYINVGVSLQILPRISSDGRVTSQIFCEVSSIIDFVGTTPRIAVRQELTSAVLDDAEALIVGGLLQETEIRSMRKVPSLGNLPLIGQFFRDSSGSQQSTNLYIVITPHILTNGPRGTATVTPDTPIGLPATPSDDAHPGQAGEPLKPEVLTH